MTMAITACTGDELMQNPEQQPAEGEVVTVTAYAPGNNTNSRVEFNESTTQGVSFDLSWSNSDQFSVIVDDSYRTFSKVSNSDNCFSPELSSALTISTILGASSTLVLSFKYSPSK